MGLRDPAQKRRFAGTPGEMAAIAAYNKAMKTLEQSSRSSAPGDEEDESEEENVDTPNPKKKKKKKKKPKPNEEKEE